MAATGGAKKTIKVEDNIYAPKTITVSKGTTVTWKWPGFEQAGDVHDVSLQAGPKGVKKIRSDAAATDYSFKRKLSVPGTYKIVCTLHHEMHMTIRVKH
jgi:plastocyanin